MKKQNARPSDAEIEAWENGRNLLEEISQGISDFNAGKPNNVRIVEVTEAIHARRMSGLSQSEFAQLIDVSPRTYQEWEQGRRSPTGAARVLLRLISRKPELIKEIRKNPPIPA
jgi:putative transcriptional regulator